MSLVGEKKLVMNGRRLKPKSSSRKTIFCPECGSIAPSKAMICYACGESLKNPKGLLNKIVWYGPIFLATIAFITIIVTIIGPEIIHESLFPGHVESFAPVGFAIKRGIAEFDQPSDHLILPIEWKNTKKSVEIIHLPSLILTNISSGEKLRFSLAGEYDDISPESFSKVISIKQSFVLSPESITDKTLAFHIDNWWNPEASNYNFSFKSGEEYNVDLGFYSGYDNKTTYNFCQIYIPDSINEIEYNSSNSWVYFSIYDN